MECLRIRIASVLFNEPVKWWGYIAAETNKWAWNTGGMKETGENRSTRRKHHDLVPLYSTVLKCYCRWRVFVYCYFASYGSSDKDDRLFYFNFEIIVPHHTINARVTVWFKPTTTGCTNSTPLSWQAATCYFPEPVKSTLRPQISLRKAHLRITLVAEQKVTTNGTYSYQCALGG